MFGDRDVFGVRLATAHRVLASQKRPAKARGADACSRYTDSAVKIDRSKCTFCPTGDGRESNDHVPPDCFFWQPKPDNLITVPCCNQCRGRDQGHDRFIRNLFISFVETECHPMVAAKLTGRRDKSFYEDRQMMARLTALMTKVDGRDAFEINKDSAVGRFVERVTRGMIWQTHQVPFFSANLDWTVHRDADLIALAVAEEIAHRHVGEVFSYAVSRSGRDWLVTLAFYQGLQLAVRLTEQCPLNTV